MVVTPKFVFANFILVRCPIAISVATDGDSTREAREFDNLFGCAKLMWFFFIFFLSPFFFLFRYVYSCLFLIFGIVVCVYSLVFGIIVMWGFGYTLYSFFTHTHTHTHTHFIHYMSKALYLGLSCIELEGIV